MNNEPWFHFSRLAEQGEQGRKALSLLENLNLFKMLQPFNPVLAGTHPIGLNLVQSDLDILCETPELDSFSQIIQKAFGHLPSWSLRRKTHQKQPSLVAGFSKDGIAVEIFAQACPVWFQHGFRHMLVERRLLAVVGEPLRQRVRALKKQGRSTEQAFAEILGLSGDPHTALYQLSFLTRTELGQHLSAHPPILNG